MLAEPNNIDAQITRTKLVSSNRSRKDFEKQSRADRSTKFSLDWGFGVSAAVNSPSLFKHRKQLNGDKHRKRPTRHKSVEKYETKKDPDEKRGRNRSRGNPNGSSEPVEKKESSGQQRRRTNSEPRAPRRTKSLTSTLNRTSSQKSLNAAPQSPRGIRRRGIQAAASTTLEPMREKLQRTASKKQNNRRTASKERLPNLTPIDASLANSKIKW